MSGVKKFAEARTKSGDVVMEFFGPSQSKDALSIGLQVLACALQSKAPDAERGGGVFGGAFGYGVDFENDVFLMHPYCWCEREECLWCGGSSCQGNIQHEPHRKGCYQEHLQAFAREHGEKLGVYDGVEHFHVPYGSPKTKQYDALKRRLCKEMGLNFKLGNQVHCSCGVDAEWKRRYDACECDWHRGLGRFRFGAAADAPHFWHKASDFQVRWYKYIGRDQHPNRAIHHADWLDVLTSCLASIGFGLDDACELFKTESAEASKAAQRSMAFAMSPEGQKMFDDMVASGAVQIFGFGLDDDSES